MIHSANDVTIEPIVPPEEVLFTSLCNALEEIVRRLAPTTEKEELETIEY